MACVCGKIERAREREKKERERKNEKLREKLSVEIDGWMDREKVSERARNTNKNAHTQHTQHV
jgi:hypothetical protein